MINVERNSLQCAVIAAVLAMGLFVDCKAQDPATEAEMGQRAAAMWPERCQALVSRLDQNQRTELVFEAHPGFPDQRVFQLRWNGVSAPIPPLDYKELRVVRGQPFDEPSPQNVVQLYAQGGGFVFLGHSDGFGPMNNVFQSAMGGSGRDEMERYWTNTLFDGPVTMASLNRLGYRHRLSDLSCRGKRWREEAPIAIGLILTGMAGPYTLSHVYEIPGQEGSWLVQGRDPGRNLKVWRAVLPKVGETTAGHIEIGIRPDDTPEAVGLGIGAPMRETAPARHPQWLLALGEALTKDDQAAWMALRSALIQAGFTDESVQSVTAVIDDLR
ncbi:hypothetical protein QWY84_12890 [Aquisalimonas lutea]|uniref:hypothetical protein n=1 Tax=Aquisalimonas lutea TaxID=1327750 RepID=UPI0025B4DB5C|nr:hypothetical protein [Aquisalimonas lutea]MDN3518511.1 hypothetical protein [Aquisalimonas lutea]